MTKNDTDTELVTFTPAPLLIDYWDKSNPRAVINVAGEEVAEFLIDNQKELSYLLNEDEGALRKIVKPTPDMNHLRHRFWREFSIAQDAGTDINMKAVTDGIVTPKGLQIILSSVGKLAWFMKPPKDYMEDTCEALFASMAKLREIIALEILDEDGKPDTKVINAQLKAFNMLDNRVKGLPTQYSYHRSHAVNIHQSSKDATKGMKNILLTEEEQLAQELLDIQQEIVTLEYKDIGNDDKISTGNESGDSKTEASPSTTENKAD